MANRDIVTTNCKMLDLWNGSSNNTAPANWWTTGFDDSGWSTPVSPTNAGSMKYSANRVPAYIYNNTLPVGGPVPVWPTSSPSSTHQYAILRWHFALPAAYTLNDIVFWTPDDVVDGVFGALGESDVAWNGQFIGGSMRFPVGTSLLSGMQTNFGAVAVAGDNLLAIQFRAFAGCSFTPDDAVCQMWTSHAWFTARIDITAQGGRSYAIVIG